MIVAAHKLQCEHSVKGNSTYFTTSTCDSVASGSFSFLVSPKFVPTLLADAVLIVQDIDRFSTMLQQLTDQV